MDLLIKNMELPKGSSYQQILTVQHDGSVSVEGESFIKSIAIELPPHGRLVNADKFDLKFITFRKMKDGKEIVTYDAPTVLEASNGKVSD